MYINSSSRVAVLDLTHGGIVLSRKLKKLVRSVTAIDVYNTITEVLDELENEGITTAQSPLNVDDFDVLIAPVHLDPDYPMLRDAVNKNIPVLSHHAAAGQILSAFSSAPQSNYDLRDKTIIEITGTKAKTSTSILLAEMLSREKKVISHTSQGVKDWSTGRIIKKGLSITPASTLSALDAVLEAGIEPEVVIFEISLGGTGFANIGVITTVANDYPIANNTRMASEAKRQMILNAKTGSSLVVNYDALRLFGACRRDINIISFTDTVNASCNVYYEDISSKGGVIAYYLGKRQGRIHIPENPGYDIDSYKTAFVCATAVALAMDIDDDAIDRSIREFRGAEGRMRKTSLQGRVLIDNSNSGMDIHTAEKALLYSKPEGGRIVMVLGEEAQQVCEGLDPGGVADFIDRHQSELRALVLVGERMLPFVQDNVKSIYYADNLSCGIELAIQLTNEKDIILSCVKCFR
ncbi:UDP-N-acetylmuramyl pentapeptide synthase [Candidatus Methanoperedens nitroreducens]|uniref:UDP-N-acetylmuramyl pentapeptide synthase n=1 Tax=Candidatus Methanoperedens nitratireducens TaxID=1392998 RepID=A0A062V3D0_9EURY|nr:coenzyme F430 synthase [Candidatus Methanoperedens nitroreducens]KCZ71123.1 UDP-N-acetylmuramyl pentapeptide synthase [Candidatus Methanoperedens nitroreducens]MDJ1421499.1 coenzyme F430 synthase [Candidatus Methanoperedens sp.]